MTLSNNFTIASRGLSVSIDLGALSESIIERAAEHGIKQKVADAAAGAKRAAFRNKKDGETEEQYEAAFKRFGDDPTDKQLIAETGQALMQKVVDALTLGDWGVERSAGAGLGRIDVEMAKLYIEGARMEFDKGTKAPAKYAAALEELAECAEDTQAKVRKLAESKIAKEDEEAASLSKALGDLSF